MISPRAVALQGLGYGALFVALQGLVPLPVAPPPATDESSGGTVAGAAKKDQREAFAAKAAEDKRRFDAANARSEAKRIERAQAALEQARADALHRDQERIRALIAAERLRTTLAALKTLAEPPKAQKSALPRAVFAAFAVPETVSALSVPLPAAVVPKRDHALPAPALVSAEMALKTAVLTPKTALSAAFLPPIPAASSDLTTPGKASQPSQAVALDLRNDNRRRALLALLLLNS